MKFTVIIGKSIEDFEKKMNDFLEKAGMILDVKYELDDCCCAAFILYQEAPLDKVKPEGNIAWTAPFFEEAAKILSKNKEYM